jgi:Na+/H+ antiporter NhaC
MTTDNSGLVQARALALLPLIVFLAIFLGSGIYHSVIGTEFAFYQMKAPVAAIPAIILAVLIYRGELNQGIETFLRGASHPNLILMFMVFMLAWRNVHMYRGLYKDDFMGAAANAIKKNERAKAEQSSH